MTIEEIVPKIALQLVYDDEKDLFVFNYLDADKPVFQVKMPFVQFEALAVDMMSIVKNFNLQQAREYTQRMENEKKERESFAPTGIPDSQDTDRASVRESEESKGN